VSDVFIYSVQRLALFVAALLVFLLLGAEPVLAVILAAATSMGLSYVLLRRQREAVAARVAARIERRSAEGPYVEVDADTAAEDAADDAIRARSEPADQARSAGPELRDGAPERVDQRPQGQTHPE
jgi:hypothetical protein